MISHVDDSGKPNERIALGRRAVDLAVGQGSVWALAADGVLLRIDPASAEILAEIVVGPGPSAVAVSDGGVWVAVGAALPRSSSLAGHFEAVPPGFQVDAMRPAAPGEICDPQSIVRNCVLATSGPLEAAGGITARARTAFTLRPREGGTVECNERTYSDAVVSDVRGGEAGVARLDVNGLGTLGITWDRALSVHESVAPDAGVLCVLRTGTWSGSTERSGARPEPCPTAASTTTPASPSQTSGTSSPIRPASRAPRRGSRYTETARTRRRARRHVLPAGRGVRAPRPGGRA